MSTKKKTVVIKGDTHTKLKEFCDENNFKLNNKADEIISAFLNKEDKKTEKKLLN